MEAALRALSGLAQDSRLQAFRLLVQAGPAGLPAGRIGAALDLAPATLSFHLNHLKQAGLVTCRRDSRSLIYSAAFEVMNDLLAYLTENCCRGDAAVCRAPNDASLIMKGSCHEADASSSVG